MSKMNAVSVGDLSGRHIGSRAMILDGNSISEGVLDSVWHYGTYKGDVKSRVVIKGDLGKFELNNLPGDYLIQVEAQVGDEG